MFEWLKPFQFIVVLTFTVSVGVASAQEDGQRPNVLLIYVDDMGYNDLGCYGAKDPGIKTPNIDRLAAEGVRFSNYLSACSVCSPSRAAVLTGRYPQRNGMPVCSHGRTEWKDWYEHVGLPQSEITIAELLKPLGYATAAFGKWHLGAPDKFAPRKQGFDKYVGRIHNFHFKCNIRREPDHHQRIAAMTLGGHYANPVAQGEPYNKWNGADVLQGFAVRVGGATKTLDRNGFPGVTFRGAYPIGKVNYAEDGFPVKVRLEAFSPFIPLNTKDSALPATVMSYTVTNTSDATVEVDLGGWMQNATCPYVKDAKLGSRTNAVAQADDHVSLVSSVAPSKGSNAIKDRHGYGSMALTLLHAPANDQGISINAAAALAFPERPESLFSQTDGLDPAAASKPLNQQLVGGLSAQFKLKPGESKTLDFLITWYFPDYNELNAIRVQKRTQDSRFIFKGKRRHYAPWFDSAGDVASYLAKNKTRLLGGTRRWNETWYDSTLPHWLLDRSLISIDCLQTQTFHWFDDGRPWAWEGVDCCPGTCTHVFHYAQGMARIFPDLERALREKTDFKVGVGFDPKSGRINDRGDYGRHEAIDGQSGTILRAYREHQMSADSEFLKRIWPNVRKAIVFLINKDEKQDGVLEGKQRHTLDASWSGPMGWLSGMYLAALAAGEAMATEMGDADFAKRCRTILDRGSKKIVDDLFDGEYFIHKPTGAKGLNTNKGCHIDQVLGQAWTKQVGLGRVIPKEQTVSALSSLWKYNFAPDAGRYALDHVEIESAFRWYAMPGEAGLVMCTWPKGGAVQAVPGNKKRGKDNPKVFTGVGGYFNECMNGFEYQVAAHMLYEADSGDELVEKGLAIAKAVHERYGADKRNPYNEIECSDHYARSMASYGVFLAACGFEYHGPKGHIAFAPRVSPDNFKAPFTAAEGWGSFAQKVAGGQQTGSIELRYGTLALSEFALDQVAGTMASRAEVLVDGKEISAEFQDAAGRYVVRFPKKIALKAGQSLEVRFV